MALNACLGASSTPQASPETLALGARLYAQRCQSCHGDATSQGRVTYVPSNGPDGHSWQHSTDDLVYIVLNGSDPLATQMRELTGVPKDAPLMPAFKGVLSEDETRAIIERIKTLWTDDQRREQERVRSLLNRTKQ